LGAPLGYIASYFAQPGLLRAFHSLGDYVAAIIYVLSPPSLLEGGPLAGLALHVQNSIFQTAWIGVFLGALIMAIIFTVIGNKSR